MNEMIRHDVQRLMAEIERVGVVLERLEKDHALWVRDREENDLSEFMKHISLLEIRMSRIMGKCVSYDNYGRAKTVAGIQRSFAYLDTVFQDLKKARHDLKEAYIHPEELKNLEIDWARFRKNIRKSLNQLGAGMDNENTEASSRENQDCLFT